MQDEGLTSKVRTLLVVAHPDDEVLWFLGGIKEISEITEMELFCLTYTEDSERGIELKNACRDLKIKIFFGGCSDPGISRCISNVRESVSSFINLRTEKSKFEMIITHPFHGGEKPHPHHIQLFHAVRSICAEKKSTFGFFSERLLPIPQVSKNQYKFSNLFEVKLALEHLGFLICKRAGLIGTVKVASMLVSDWFKRTKNQIFAVQTFYVEPEEKKKVLANYKSQEEFLKNYKTPTQTIEYLYLEK